MHLLLTATAACLAQINTLVLAQPVNFSDGPHGDISSADPKNVTAPGNGTAPSDQYIPSVRDQRLHVTSIGEEVNRETLLHTLTGMFDEAVERVLRDGGGSLPSPLTNLNGGLEAQVYSLPGHGGPTGLFLTNEIAYNNLLPAVTWIFHAETPRLFDLDIEILQNGQYVPVGHIFVRRAPTGTA